MATEAPVLVGPVAPPLLTESLSRAMDDDATCSSSAPAAPLPLFPASTTAPVDAQGWPVVPRLVDSDYRVLYLPTTAPGQGDVFIHIHLSGVAVLGIARNHPIRAQGKTVTAVRYAPAASGGDDGASNSNGSNKRAYQVAGRKKKGAIRFRIDSELCRLSCSDGSEYTVCASLNGKLLETNGQILQTPGLVSSDGDDSGFLALFMVSEQHLRALLDSLMTPSQYAAHLADPSLFAGRNFFAHKGSARRGGRRGAGDGHGDRHGEDEGEAEEEEEEAE